MKHCRLSSMTYIYQQSDPRSLREMREEDGSLLQAIIDADVSRSTWRFLLNVVHFKRYQPALLADCRAKPLNKVC